MNKYLNTIVQVVIDRPLGSRHPEFKDTIYPINYGYVVDVIAGDGMEQDCYVLGVDVPIDSFEGRVIAIIQRVDDNEDKWVVAHKDYSLDEIKELTSFTEKYFKSTIIKWGVEYEN